MGAETLADLDAARRASGEPSGRGGVVREFAADGSECRIVFSRLSAEETDDVIREETASADEGGYSLEWKLYGHDDPSDLGERLLAAGFATEDVEQVLMLRLEETTLAAFSTRGAVIRRVHDAAGLADYAEIARENSRENPEREQEQLASILLGTPEQLSIHIAYVEEVPTACGRLHFTEGHHYAELAGARTKTAYRGRGLYTAVVGARLAEARDRGRSLVFTDALPTSEPILTRRGFRAVTSTRPFLYEPAPHHLAHTARAGSPHPATVGLPAPRRPRARTP